jgi:hypothetical protein
VRNKTKNALLTVSLALNALFLAFIVPALLVKTASVVFQDPGDGGVTAAAIATVPADGGAAVFNAAEITLKQGSSARYQFSLLSGGKQANWLMDTLYDHALIAVKPDGYGLLISALAPGETVMQTLTGEGIRDFLHVRVTE